MSVRTVFKSLGVPRWHIVNERIKSGGQAAVLVVANDAGQKGVFRCLIDPDPVSVERFHRELRILIDPRFRHPNIVEILDHTNTPSEHWYISRFGHSFNMYWKAIRDATDDPVSVIRKAVEIVAKLADGLGPLHCEGVVHRDIKPRNIVMRTDAATEPVLIDFGIAHATAFERLTDTDEAVGNRRYSPDVAMHRMEAVSPWVDIFQLAQLLIWMLQCPAGNAWDRPLDWRYVTYDDRLPGNVVAAIRGITARCCEEKLSPRDGRELASFLRQRVLGGIPIAVPSASVDVAKIQEAKTLGQSLQDIAVAEDLRAVEAAATAIAPVCLEIVDGLHGLVTSAAELGLKVTPGKKKNFDEIVEIAMARLRRHGMGMYNATFYGDHGHLAIYCNLEVRLPSDQRRRVPQRGRVPPTNPIVLIECTRIGGAKARVERHITLEADGTLMLRDGKYKPVGPSTVDNVIQMFKDWIEDPEVWAALQRDR